MDDVLVLEMLGPWVACRVRRGRQKSRCGSVCVAGVDQCSARGFLGFELV